MVTVTQPRSLQQHRLLFGMLRKVHENLPLDMEARFPKVENLLATLKLQLGYVDEHVELVGDTWTVVLVPRSIAWDNMDQAEFGQFFRDAVEFICTNIIPELDSQLLMDEVNDMLA